jgi:hypothetical protein
MMILAQKVRLLSFCASCSQPSSVSHESLKNAQSVARMEISLRLCDPRTAASLFSVRLAFKVFA